MYVTMIMVLILDDNNCCARLKQKSLILRGKNRFVTASDFNKYLREAAKIVIFSAARPLRGGGGEGPGPLEKRTFFEAQNQYPKKSTQKNASIRSDNRDLLL